MTKQVVWTYRKLFFLQFDTKFASKQQRLAKIGTILWCCCRPKFCKFYLLWIRYVGEKANIIKHTYPVVDPYRPLLALPQKVG